MRLRNPQRRVPRHPAKRLARLPPRPRIRRSLSPTPHRRTKRLVSHKASLRCVDRLRNWSRPGLLCIGDSAHAMSPIGGVGINLAIQDAVAAANALAQPLSQLQSSAVPDANLRKLDSRDLQLHDWMPISTKFKIAALSPPHHPRPPGPRPKTLHRPALALKAPITLLPLSLLFFAASPSSAPSPPASSAGLPPRRCPHPDTHSLTQRRSKLSTTPLNESFQTPHSCG